MWRWPQCDSQAASRPAQCRQEDEQGRRGGYKEVLHIVIAPDSRLETARKKIYKLMKMNDLQFSTL